MMNSDNVIYDDFFGKIIRLAESLNESDNQ